MLKSLRQPYLPALLAMLPAGIAIWTDAWAAWASVMVVSVVIMMAVHFNPNYALSALTCSISAMTAGGWQVARYVLKIIPTVHIPEPWHDSVLWTEMVFGWQLERILIPATVAALTIPLFRRGTHKLKLTDWRQNADRSETNSLGSAAFATDEEMNALVGPAGAILGRAPNGGLMRAFKLAKKIRVMIDGHLMTWAKTRGGKGTNTILTNALLLDHPMVFNSPKGEEIMVAGRIRRERGYHSYNLDPYGVTEGQSGVEDATYNPMAYIKKDRYFTRRIQGIRQALIFPAEHDQEHFLDLAGNGIDALIAWVMEKYPRREQNLGTVYDLAHLPDDDLTELWEQMQEDPRVGQGLCARGANVFLGLKDAELSGAKSTLKRGVGFIQDPNIRAVLAAPHSRNEVRFEEVYQGRADIFVTIPYDILKAQPRLSRLVFSQLTTELMLYRRENTVATRIIAMMDEFQCFGRMQVVLDNWNSIAGYGLSYWLFVHNYDSLKAIYSQHVSTFDTADVTQVLSLGAVDISTAEKVEKGLGKYTVITRGSQVNAGKQGAAHLPVNGRDSMGESVSEGEQARSLMTASEILQMPKTKQIIFMSGQPPMIADRATYYSDAEFRGLFDNNPLAESQENFSKTETAL